MTEQNRSRRRTTSAPVEPVQETAVVAPPAPEVKAVKPTVKVETDMVFRRRLEQGDHGPAVAEVQRLLSLKGGWDGPLDGRYGTLLARALRVFQGAEGLKVNGEVDVLTWKALTR